MKFASLRKFGKDYYIIQNLCRYKDVYSVLDSSSKLYIIKSFPEESKHQKFLYEIEINKKLNTSENNEFFVRYISSSIEEFFALEKYIVFELCEKGPLSEYVKTCVHFEEIFLKIIFYKLLNIVFHMHRADVVHMDISLKNIFIDCSYNFKLGGFDHSLIVSDKKNKNIYFRKDIIDLAFVFIQILTGKILQNNKIIKKIIQSGNSHSFWKVVEIQPYCDFHFPNDLKDLINKMLFKKDIKLNDIENLLSHDWFKKIKNLNKNELKEYIEKEFIKFEEGEL